MAKVLGFYGLMHIHGGYLHRRLQAAELAVCVQEISKTGLGLVVEQHLQETERLHKYPFSSTKGGTLNSKLLVHTFYFHQCYLTLPSP